MLATHVPCYNSTADSSPTSSATDNSKGKRKRTRIDDGFAVPKFPRSSGRNLQTDSAGDITGGASAEAAFGITDEVVVLCDPTIAIMTIIRNNYLDTILRSPGTQNSDQWKWFTSLTKAPASLCVGWRTNTCAEDDGCWQCSPWRTLHHFIFNSVILPSWAFSVVIWFQVALHVECNICCEQSIRMFFVILRCKHPSACKSPVLCGHLLLR